MQPNIIFILSDQHNSKIMGCAGDKYIRTPNLDKMAKSGVLLENCYCPAPLCVPSRTSIMTGQYPHRHQVVTNQHSLNSYIPTVAHSLTISGYESVLAGRMDFRGFDQYHGYEKHLVGDITSMIPGYDNLEEVLGDLKDTLPQRRASLEKAGPGHSAAIQFDDDVTRATLEFIENRKDDRPLFLTVGLFAPHNPYICEQELFDYYDKVLPKETYSKEDCQDHPYDNAWKKCRDIEDVPDEMRWKSRAAYYGLVEYLDRNIGLILSKIEDKLDMDNTIIVYASDHGDSVGYRGLFWKSHFYEDAIKVPAIIMAPGRIKEGRRMSGLTSLVDLAPSFTDYGSGKDLPSVEGTSLKAALEEEDRISPDRYVISELGMSKGIKSGATIRQGDWKLIYYSEESYGNQLFNVLNDPDEENNLIHIQKYEQIREKLENLLLDKWDPEKANRMSKEGMINFRIMKEWSEKARLDVEDKWKGKEYVSRNQQK